MARVLQAHQRRLAGRGAAFSLLELVIVTAIVSTLSAVVLVRYSASAANYRVQLAAEKIAADLEWARQRARSTGEAKRVAFSPGRNVYGVTGERLRPGVNTVYAVDLESAPYFSRVNRPGGVEPPAVIIDAYGWADRDWSVRILCGRASRTVSLGKGGGVAISTP